MLVVTCQHITSRLDWHSSPDSDYCSCLLRVWTLDDKSFPLRGKGQMRSVLQVSDLGFSANQAATVAGHRSVFLRNLAILLCRRREACSALQVLCRVDYLARSQM